MKSYRELGAPELITWFAKLVHGRVNKGRDAAMLSRYMNEKGLTSTQILLGYFEYRETDGVKDIPSFIRGNWGYGEDLIQDEAELVLKLTYQPAPSFFITYCDLVDLDIPDAQYVQVFQEAKERLEKFNDDALNKPASSNIRGGSTRKPNFDGTAFKPTGLRRRQK